MMFDVITLLASIEIFSLILAFHFLGKKKQNPITLTLAFIICLVVFVISTDFLGPLVLIVYMAIITLLLRSEETNLLKRSTFVSFSVIVLMLSSFFSQFIGLVINRFNMSEALVLSSTLIALLAMHVLILIQVRKLFLKLDVYKVLDISYGLILIWFINGIIIIYCLFAFIENVITIEDEALFLQSLVMILLSIDTLIAIVFLSIAVKNQRKFDETSKVLQVAARAWGEQQEEAQHLDIYAQGLKENQGAVEKTKHNYKYIIPSIIHLVEENDIEGLRDYLQKNEATIEEFQNVMMGDDTTSDVIKISGPDLKPIRGILLKMLSYAKKMNVKMTVEVYDVIESINFEKMPLVNILGTWLENAIEEADLTDEREIHISFVKMENSPIMGDCAIITVTNSCTPDLPSFDEMKKQGFSTKGENRGYGLSNVFAELKKAENVEHDTLYEKGKFVQKLVIFND